MVYKTLSIKEEEAYLKRKKKAKEFYANIANGKAYKMQEIWLMIREGTL